MTDSNAPKLKPCPFCGGQAEYYKQWPGGVGASGMEDPEYLIECVICRATNRYPYATKEHAADRWNRRADAIDVEKLREVIRGAIDVPAVLFHKEGADFREELADHVFDRVREHLGGVA